MKSIGASAPAIAIIVLGLLLAGCTGSMQARSVDLKKPLLVDPALLQKGSGDQALYRYVNPKADIKHYTKVMIDPVLIGKSGELSAEERENYQKLANNAYVLLTRELEKDYTVVNTPQPDTMRVQMGISDADPSKPVRNVLSTVMPIGVGLSLARYAATGKQSGVGEITGELKVTDALSGELIGAGIDRRVGGKDVKGHFDTWHNANDALEYWAKRMRYVLCTARGGTGCEKP